VDSSQNIFELVKSWTRVLLEKLIVTQLVKKFVFYATRRFIIVFTRAHHWAVTLGS